LLSRCSDIKEALDVSIYDAKVRTDLVKYISLGLPSMGVMLIDWSSLNVLVVVAGFMGTTQ